MRSAKSLSEKPRFGKEPINRRPRFSRRTGLLALLALPLAVAFAAPAHAATGDLTQKPGTAGCISESGASGKPDYTPGGCQDGLALSVASSVVISPDGKNAYVSSAYAVAVFDRNGSTGELTQKTGTEGCTASTNDPRVDSCALGDGLGSYSTHFVAVSPDGGNVYLASGDGIAIFTRNLATGVLTQTGDASGCVTEEGKGAHPIYRAGECQDGRALAGARSIAIPPDGKTLYVASAGWVAGAGQGIAIFDRNTATGALTQKTGTAGCVVEDNTLAAVTTCADGRALAAPTSINISPDGNGKSLYLSSSPYYPLSPDAGGAIAVFDRDPTTGNINQKAGTAGCVAEDNTVPAVNTCADGRALGGPNSVVTSVDDLGKSLYVASGTSGAIAVFDRDTNTGVISQKAGTSGCVQEDASFGCADGKSIDSNGGGALATSPDGRSLYFANYYGAIASFDRALSGDIGKLTQKPGTDGCISNDGALIDFPLPTSPGSCVDGDSMFGANDLDLSPDGKNLYSAAELDGDGAVAVFDREQPVDTTPPDTAINTGPTGPTGDSTPTFGFSSEPGATFECRVDTNAFSSCSSPETLGTLAEGPHTFEVRATDSAGNTDPSPATRNFTVDTTPPDTMITSGPSGTIATDRPTFTFAGTPAGDTAKVQCLIEFGRWQDCTSPSVIILEDGTHTAEFRAEDAAGNQDPTPATRTFTVDTTAPHTTIDSGPSGTVDTRNVTFTFTSERDTAKVQCNINSRPFSDCSSPKTFSGLGDGFHQVTFRAEDALGNQDPAPATRTFTVDTKVQAAATTKKKQRQTGKDIEIQIVINVKEPVEIEPLKCAQDWAVWVKWCAGLEVSIDLGGARVIAPLPIWAACWAPNGDREKECLQGFPDFTPLASSSASGKCGKLTDDCVFGSNITLTLRPKKEKAERRILDRLKDGKKVVVKETLALTDIAGNTKTKKLKVKLTRKPKNGSKKKR